MKKWDMIEPYYGAHIRVEIGKLYHHGIYIGNDEVVQFGLPMDVYRDPKTVKVIKSPISDFLGGGFLEVRRYDRKELKQKNSDEEIVRIALSKLGEGDYNILTNNCEHFCNFCIFGKKISTQVDSVHDEVRKKLGL